MLSEVCFNLSNGTSKGLIESLGRRGTQAEKCITVFCLVCSFSFKETFIIIPLFWGAGDINTGNIGNATQGEL